MTRLAGEMLLNSGKLAKSQSTFNIAPTKPVRDSGQVVRLGIIERNPKTTGQYSEALACPARGQTMLQTVWQDTVSRRICGPNV
jgi:hypothetical protein